MHSADKFEKIGRNKARDIEIDKALHALNWQVLRFWEGDIEKRLDECVSDVQDAILQDIIQQSNAVLEYPENIE